MFFKFTPLLFLALTGSFANLLPFPQSWIVSPKSNSTESPCAVYEYGIKEAVRHIDWNNLTSDEPNVKRIQQLCKDGKDCFKKENNTDMQMQCLAWSPEITEFMICFRYIAKNIHDKCPKPNDPRDCKALFPMFDCAKEEMRKNCPPSVMDYWDETMEIMKKIPGCS